jgi:hypothetical protein
MIKGLKIKRCAQCATPEGPYGFDEEIDGEDGRDGNHYWREIFISPKTGLCQICNLTVAAAKSYVSRSQ